MDLSNTNTRDQIIGSTKERSHKWPAVQKLHLKFHPVCECCGSSKKLNVHHMKPFHLFPELELDLNNLITLCMDKECHLKIGHGGNFKDYNPNVEEDTKTLKSNIALFESVAEHAMKSRLDA